MNKVIGAHCDLP